MYMAYTTNPRLPRVRMEAVRLMRKGWGIRETARHLGYSHGAVLNWVKRDPGNWHLGSIPTRSSRPYHHPNQLRDEVVSRILCLRDERHQCAEILRHRLREEGIAVSLSSVKRTLRRCGISRFPPTKKWHEYPPRPFPGAPGILIEIDTVHDGDPRERMDIYTLIDVCSRWAYAIPSLGMSTWKSLRFVEEARKAAPFGFSTIQSDHGPEFSRWFTKRILERGMGHRHTRIRTPNDNAHLERFNRTIQEECIARIPRNIVVWRKEIPEYLNYYNTQRPHMGLGMKTPAEILHMVTRS